MRLGPEATATPTAVYANWQPSGTDYAAADAYVGTQWTSHAEYIVWDNDGAVSATIHNVDQTQSPGGALPNDRPWKLLGVWSVPADDTLHVELSFDYGYGSPQPGDVLCAGDVMIHAIWPTVSIRPTTVSVNPKVASANAGDYVDWVNACQSINIPVEGQGARVELQLQASIETLYTQTGGSMSDWQYLLPAIPCLNFWNNASGGTPLTPDQGMSRATLTHRTGSTSGQSTPPPIRAGPWRQVRPMTHRPSSSLLARFRGRTVPQFPSISFAKSESPSAQ